MYNQINSYKFNCLKVENQILFADYVIINELHAKNTMKEILLEIGCDGGNIIINSKCVHGVFFFEFNSGEVFEQSNSKTITFTILNDAWSYLKQRYPNWHQLYLVQINPQMTEIVKSDYILSSNKNEYTIDSWLVQLTGRGIGF